MLRALALVLALVAVGPSNAACPSGYTATCPSGFSVSSTVEPETISATNLEGCVWFCKCDTCFGCTTTDASTNEVLSNVDIVTRVDARNNAGGASNLQTYLATFYGSRYDDAKDASCADSEKKKMKKKATRSTRLGEDQRGSEGAASTVTTASLNVPGSTEKTVARDESLVSVNEGTEFDPIVNTGTFNMGGGPTQPQFTTRATPPPTPPTPPPTPGEYEEFLLRGLTQEAFASQMHAVSAADVAKVTEWAEYAYNTLNHQDTLTGRYTDLKTAIQNSMGSTVTVSVTSKTTLGSLGGHKYAEVRVCKNRYLYKYNILVSTHTSATASGQPLLFSRVAAQLDGYDQKVWDAIQAGFVERDCHTDGNTVGYGYVDLEGSTTTSGAFLDMNFEQKWNDELAAIEPHVRGAISEMRFDIINA